MRWRVREFTEVTLEIPRARPHVQVQGHKQTSRWVVRIFFSSLLRGPWLQPPPPPPPFSLSKHSPCFCHTQHNKGIIPADQLTPEELTSIHNVNIVVIAVSSKLHAKLSWGKIPIPTLPLTAVWVMYDRDTAAHRFTVWMGAWQNYTKKHFEWSSRLEKCYIYTNHSPCVIFIYHQ